MKRALTLVLLAASGVVAASDARPAPDPTALELRCLEHLKGSQRYLDVVVTLHYEGEDPVKGYVVTGTAAMHGRLSPVHCNFDPEQPQAVRVKTVTQEPRPVK